MSKLDHALKEAVAKQYQKQRKNLLAVARLCVQTVCDESGCSGVIDDNSETLSNLCTIIESILCHGFRAGSSNKKVGYGPDAIQYWDFIRQACKSVPYNSIQKIQAIDDLKTFRGKGRAWIRMSLMEKRLSEYFSVALMEDSIIRRYYDRGSFMASEEAHIFTNVATALNTVDFSLCLRDSSFDLPVVYTVDYSPFLKYPLSDKQLDLEETLLRLERNRLNNDASSTCSGHTSVSEKEPSAEDELSRTKRSLKLVVDQKAYLEEILNLKDLKCNELTQQLLDWDKQVEEDRKQSEEVILELQNQLLDQQQTNRLLQEQLSEFSCNPNEMEPINARSRYSVSLHRPAEGVDVVAEMDRNGYCSKSSSEQSMNKRFQDHSNSRLNSDSLKRSSETLLTRTSSHSGAERPGASTNVSSGQRKARSSSNYNNKMIASAVEDLMPSEREKLQFAVSKKLQGETFISFGDS